MQLQICLCAPLSTRMYEMDTLTADVVSLYFLAMRVSYHISYCECSALVYVGNVGHVWGSGCVYSSYLLLPLPLCEIKVCLNLSCIASYSPFPQLSL